MTPGQGGQSQQLMWREINTNAKDKPQRQKVRAVASFAVVTLAVFCCNWNVQKRLAREAIAEVGTGYRQEPNHTIRFKFSEIVG